MSDINRLYEHRNKNYFDKHTFENVSCAHSHYVSFPPFIIFFLGGGGGRTPGTPFLETAPGKFYLLITDATWEHNPTNPPPLLQICRLRNLLCKCFLIQCIINSLVKCGDYITLTLIHIYSEQLSWYTKGQVCWMCNQYRNTKTKKKTITAQIEFYPFHTWNIIWPLV